MKWTLPKHDNRRVVRRFAWFMTYMHDEEVKVWCEHYYSGERYNGYTKSWREVYRSLNEGSAVAWALKTDEQEAREYWDDDL